MELLISVITYFFIGLFVLVGIAIVVSIFFGRKVVKNWEYETRFMDGRKERGEFDVESYRFADETGNRLKMTCVLRDTRLKAGHVVAFYLDSKELLAGNVTQDGRVSLGKKDMTGSLDDLRAGMICELKCNGETWYTSELYED